MPDRREAACQCGQLRVVTTGEPWFVSVCHCLDCQRRSGSAFSMQAGFKADEVEVSGRYTDYTRISDEDDRRAHVFHFCPECGSQVFQSAAGDPDFIAVAVGSFADPSFPPPTESSYDHRRHHWVELPATIHAERPELWDEVKPLYDAGRYAEAADRGREILAEHPRQGRLTYNLACVESLAGRTDDAVGHLREAIDMWEGCRDMAKGDPDFDPIRDEPGFVELIEA